MPKTESGHGSNPRITGKMSAAIDAMIDGSAKTETHAARLAGLHPETFRRGFRKPHVIAEVRRRIDQRLGGVALAKASGVLEKLMTKAESEYVRLDAAKHTLAIGGIKPKADGTGTSAGGGIALKITFNHVVQGSIGAAGVQPITIDAQPIDEAHASEGNQRLR